MEGSESTRSHGRRDYDDNTPDENRDEDSEHKKTRSGKSRKHSYSDEDDRPSSRRREEEIEWDPQRKSSSSKTRSNERDESKNFDRREKEKEKATRKKWDDYDERDNKEKGGGGRYYKETDERDRGFSDSDNERSVGTTNKERDEERSLYKGRDNKGWSEKNRDHPEGSRDYWKDSAGFHSRTGFRKDSRARPEGGMKGSSGFGNRNESSDSIEIRPNRNLDFGDFGSNEDKWVGPDEDSPQPSESQFSRGRGGNKGGTGANNNGPGLGFNNPGSSSFGQRGGRALRGGRGRGNVRDAQRIGVQMNQMPIMGPPFGPLGLPPGPIQPPGLIQPNIFIPPFPGPLVWPGSRGIDVNLLATPPNLPPILPPVPSGPRFGSTGPNHPLHLTQPANTRSSQSNTMGSGLGFSSPATPSRDIIPHDKPSNSWAPQRNTGLAGKAPSRGEQNDYSQNFVDTGMRPQNFIRELELSSVVEDYPKLRELIQRKDEIVAKSATAPLYYKCDLREHVLSPEFFGTKFDVILVDPPWEEYVHRAPGVTDHIEYWTFEEIMNLKIEAIADTPSFIFLWVGDGVGLEQGRQCLKKWGFRRCEDICWVKTNKKNVTPALRHDSHTLFQHSKEHCLMGIKGTVRRSTDGHIIHANIDTDIIIEEEPSDGSTKKPEDMYRIIEHFALGSRRLELFGEDHNIRPGWLTLGKGLSSSNFNKEAYLKNFADKDGRVWQGGGGRNPPPDAPHLVLTTPEIESLRPKSPPQKNQQQSSLTPLGSGGSNNRRLSSNSPQNSVTIVGSEPATPAHWNASPVVGFGLAEGGMVGPDGNMFDGFGFNPVLS